MAERAGAGKLATGNTNRRPVLDAARPSGGPGGSVPSGTSRQSRRGVLSYSLRHGRRTRGRRFLVVTAGGQGGGPGQDYQEQYAAHSILQCGGSSQAEQNGSGPEARPVPRSPNHGLRPKPPAHLFIDRLGQKRKCPSGIAYPTSQSYPRMAGQSNSPAPTVAAPARSTCRVARRPACGAIAHPRKPAIETPLRRFGPTVPRSSTVENFTSGTKPTADASRCATAGECRSMLRVGLNSPTKGNVIRSTQTRP
jgi:hypothetical protein